jgi:hypothetical protein
MAIKNYRPEKQGATIADFQVTRKGLECPQESAENE